MRTDARELLAVGIFGSKSRIAVRIETLLLGGRILSPRTSGRHVIVSVAALGAMMAASSLAPRWILFEESAFAQQQNRPSFDVASVKPIDRATMHRDHEGARLDAGIFVDRTDLLQFIIHAYIRGGSCTLKAALGEDCPLIAGNLPAWVKADRWEIQAKLPADSTVNYTTRQLQTGDTPQLNLMLQAFLEDRFHLVVHHETREIPIYALIIGRNGPKLKHTAPTGELVKADGTLVEHHGLAGMRRIPGSDGAVRNQLNFQASSMRDTAATLGWFFDRPVLDRTGLAGEYDFAIEYEVDPGERGPVSTPNISGLGGNYFNPYTGLTSAALSADLQAIGLRLESTKAPIELLVIDHVEKPDAN